jgi:hypothetical protein
MIPATPFVILAASMSVTALPALAQMSDNDTGSMTCQQMIEKTQPLVDKMTDKSKISLAQHVMTNAKVAMENGNMEECKLQVQKVMVMTQSNSNK